jgi:pimeloyl-ACP methyl ester carboxylesterase
MITVSLLVLQAAVAPLQATPFAWSPVDGRLATGDSIAADTARLWVKEHHDRDEPARVGLKLLRLRATTPAPGPPIVYLAGGPGSAGIPSQPLFSPLVLALRESGDVIFFDQRGTGRSLPSLVIPGTLNLPGDQPLRSAATEARLVTLARAMRDSLAARGVDPSAYTTIESVEDLEALRVAIGAERLVVWGHSYGSHLALAYLKRHPGRVARLMIGGVNGTDQRWRPPADGDVLLARVDSAVRADAGLRAAMPDFLGTVRRVMQRLQREPIMVEQDGRRWLVGRDEVATTIAIQSGDIEFIRRLPMLFAALDRGNAELFVRVMRQTVHERPIGTAMTYYMTQASGFSAARAARVARETPSAILGNAINWPFDVPAFTDALAAPDLGDDFRAPVRSDVPALLYSGTFDGRTSLGDAEEVRRVLPNVALVIVDGASHSPHTMSIELMQVMRDFVAGRPARSRHLSVPLDLRGPQEPRQIGELMRLVNERGAEAAIARLRQLVATPQEAVSSYVPGSVGVNLQSARPADALAIWSAGAVLFPASAFLEDRLGDAHLARGDTASARDHFARAAALDPFTLGPLVKLAQLGGGARP